MSNENGIIDYEKEIKSVYPNAYCGEFGGYNVYLRLTDCIFYSEGKTKREAWKSAYLKLKRENLL